MSLRTTALAGLGATAALLALAGPAAAKPGPARAEGIGPESYVELTLPAPGGLRILVEGGGTGIQVAVEDQAPGQARATDYQVPATESTGRLKARIPGFGSIDLRFDPKRVLPVERPAGGCGGFTNQFELGVFRGKIRFRGEDGYVDVDADRARGEVINYIRFDCADPPPSVGRTSHQTLDESDSVIQLERGFENNRRAVLGVKNGEPEGNRFFDAIATEGDPGAGPSYFGGGVIERAGPVRIFRVAVARAKSATFPFNLASGAASVAPPAPFSGSASIATNPDGSKAWTGDLSVELLGAPGPTPLVGFGMKPTLAPDFVE